MGWTKITKINIIGVTITLKYGSLLEHSPKQAATTSDLETPTFSGDFALNPQPTPKPASCVFFRSTSSFAWKGRGPSPVRLVTLR